MLALPLALMAKSVVITLTSGTQVYYQLSSDNPPVMVIADDGTFTLNCQEYAFSDVQYFTYSATDYAGEDGTVDAIASLTADGNMLMEGKASVYTLDGQLVQKGSDLSRLKAGTYVISNGKTSLKIMKR